MSGGGPASNCFEALKELVENYEDQEAGGMLHVGFIDNMHAMLTPGSLDIELF